MTNSIRPGRSKSKHSLSVYTFLQRSITLTGGFLQNLNCNYSWKLNFICQLGQICTLWKPRTFILLLCSRGMGGLYRCYFYGFWIHKKSHKVGGFVFLKVVSIIALYYHSVACHTQIWLSTHVLFSPFTSGIKESEFQKKINA